MHRVSGLPRNTADNRSDFSEDRAIRSASLGEQCFRLHLVVKVDGPVWEIAQSSGMHCADPRIWNRAIDPVHKLEVMMIWYAFLVDPCTRAGDH